MDEFITAVKIYYKKYADFGGTATRPEYWYSLLFNILVYFFAGFLAIISETLAGLIIVIQLIVNIIPSYAVSIRRLHDTDRSGWNLLWGFIPIFGGILLLIWFIEKGKPNRWASNSNLVNPVPDINVQTPQAERPRPNTPDDTDLSSGKTKFR